MWYPKYFVPRDTRLYLQRIRGEESAVKKAKKDVEKAEKAAAKAAEKAAAAAQKATEAAQKAQTAAIARQTKRVKPYEVSSLRAMFLMRTYLTYIRGYECRRGSGSGRPCGCLADAGGGGWEGECLQPLYGNMIESRPA